MPAAENSRKGSCHVLAGSSPIGHSSDRSPTIAHVIRIPPKSGGWLEVVCGPMFSGKSEEMIRRLRRAEIAGQRAVIFKPLIDDRYDAADVVSHAGIRMRAVPVADVAELLERGRGMEVVGIDEIQFFDREVVAAALALADGGARVIAAGLDQDFRRLPFGPMPELLAHAEFVDKLQAVCHRCGGPATTTQRLVDGRPAPYSGATIVVGANEQYEARCRDCHEAGVHEAGETSQQSRRNSPSCRPRRAPGAVTSTQTRRWSEVGNGKTPTSRKSGSDMSGQKTPESTISCSSAAARSRPAGCPARCRRSRPCRTSGRTCASGSRRPGARSAARRPGSWASSCVLTSRFSSSCWIAPGMLSPSSGSEFWSPAITKRAPALQPAAAAAVVVDVARLGRA